MFPEAAEAVKTTVVSSTFWRWVLYFLGFVLIVVAVLMLSGHKFNLDVTSIFRPRKLAVDAASYEFWKPSKNYGSLVIKESEMPHGFASSRYTMLIDMMWFDTRTTVNNGPHRHILHKGSDELKALGDGGKMVFEDGVQTASCAIDPATFSTLPPNGLPKRMNPGLFADPVTNDMIIFIDTEVDNKHVRESIRVPDIPLGVPFRVAVTVIDKFIEVYINCRLESTKILRGIPMNVDPEWYGISGPAALPSMIQNLKIWTTPLSAKDIQTQCGRTPAFKMSESCALKVSDKQTSYDMPPPTQQQLELGYGSALGKCR